MVTCTVSLLYPLCRSGKPWGGSFPDIPVEPWAFLFFFQKSCPFWTIRFFLANGNCELRFPPLDAGTSQVKLG